MAKTKESIYTRANSVDQFASMLNVLPDPDTVFAAKGGELSIYRQLMLDSHVDACATSRESGILSCEFDFYSDSTRRSDKAALDFIKDQFSFIDTEQLFRDIQESVYLGFSVIEKVRALDNGRMYYSELTGRPQEWFRFDPMNRLRFLSKSNPSDGELVDARSVELVKYRASYRNPYGERKAARIFWPVVFKKGDMKFWLRFVEKYGGALLWMMTDEASDSERLHMLDMLEDMVQTGVGVFKKGGPSDELTTLSVDKSGSSALFLELCNFCNAEISKAILGQTLTTEQGAVGSQALGKVHYEVRGDIVESDKKMISKTMNRLICEIVDDNFSVSVYPEFRFFEEEEVNKEKAETWAILHGMGVRFDKTLLANEFNLPEDKIEIIDASTAGTLKGTGQGDPTLKGTGQDDASAAEFAEDAGGIKTLDLTTSELQKVYDAAGELDALINKNIGEFGAGFTGFYESVKSALNGSKNYDEAMRSVLMTDGIALTEAAELLAKSILTADVIGRKNARAFARRGDPSKSRLSFDTPYRATQDDATRHQGDAAVAEFAEGLINDYATDFLKMQVPMTREDYDRLGAEYRSYAFTVTGDFQESQIEAIQQSLIAARESETPYADWLKQNLGKWELPRSRLEQIYRQNMLNADEAGRLAQMAEDTDVAPYWQVLAVMDKRTRPEHAAFHLMIRHHTDPVWNKWRGRNRFGCRCTLRSLSREYLIANGIDPDKLPAGAPSMGEVASNNANTEGFESLIEPKIGNYDSDGKLILSPQTGFAAVPDNFMKWIQIKTETVANEWIKLIGGEGNKINFKEILKKADAAQFEKFALPSSGDLKDIYNSAVENIRARFPTGIAQTRDGRQMRIDPEDFINHILPLSRTDIAEGRINRIPYLNLVGRAINDPDAITLNILEAPSNFIIAGETKLSRNYYVKISGSQYFVLVLNLNAASGGYYARTMMISTGNPTGLLIYSRK